MKRKLGITDSEDPRAIRLAWWAAFLATLALIAALGFARSAQALTLPGSVGPAVLAVAAAEDEGEDESGTEDEGEEGSEAEECEAGEDEEAEEECEAGEDEEVPVECVFSSASASVSASAASDTVRLAIHYTAFSPGSVEIIYWLRGTKGPLSLGRDRVHIGRKGVLRETEKLSAAQMTKALAARSFTVELRPAHAPRYCHGLLDRHLTIRLGSASRRTWSDPEAGFRASRLP